MQPECMEYERHFNKFIETLCDFFDELDAERSKVMAAPDADAESGTLSIPGGEYMEERRHRFWMRKRHAMLTQFKQDVVFPAYQEAVRLYPGSAGEYKTWAYYVDNGQVPTSSVLIDPFALQANITPSTPTPNTEDAYQNGNLGRKSSRKSLLSRKSGGSDQDRSLSLGEKRESGTDSSEVKKLRRNAAVKDKRSMLVKIFLPSIAKMERQRSGFQYWLKKSPVMLLTEDFDCRFPMEIFVPPHILSSAITDEPLAIDNPEACCRSALTHLGFVIDQQPVNDSLRDSMNWILGWRANTAVIIRVFEVPALVLRTYQAQCMGVAHCHAEQLYLHASNMAPYSDTYAVFVMNSKGGGPLSSKWTHWEVIANGPTNMEIFKLRGLGIGLFTHTDRPIVDDGHAPAHAHPEGQDLGLGLVLGLPNATTVPSDASEQTVV